MTRRVVAVGLVVAAVVCAGGAWWLFDTYRRASAQVERWIAETARAWDEQDLVRAVPIGDARPGRAWDEYERALALVAELPESDLDALMPLDDDWLATSVPVAGDLTARHAEAIAALRRGAALGDAQPPVDFATAFGNIPDFSTAQSLTRLAALEGLVLASETPDRAVAVWLDAMTFGLDFGMYPMVIGELMGLALVGDVVTVIADETLRAMPPDALRELADGLARVEQRMSPTSTSIRFDSAAMAAGLLAQAEETKPNVFERYLTATGLASLESAVDGILRVPVQPWPQRERALDEACEAAIDGLNPIASILLPSAASIERGCRSALAEVRMLRMAVEWRLGGDVERLADPFGTGELELREDADGAVVRSVGEPDGEPLERRVGAR